MYSDVTRKASNLKLEWTLKPIKRSHFIIDFVEDYIQIRDVDRVWNPGRLAIV